VIRDVRFSGFGEFVRPEWLGRPDLTIHGRIGEADKAYAARIAAISGRYR